MYPENNLLETTTIKLSISGLPSAGGVNLDGGTSVKQPEVVDAIVTGFSVRIHNTVELQLDGEAMGLGAHMLMPMP